MSDLPDPTELGQGRARVAAGVPPAVRPFSPGPQAPAIPPDTLFPMKNRIPTRDLLVPALALLLGAAVLRAQTTPPPRPATEGETIVDLERYDVLGERERAYSVDSGSSATRTDVPVLDTPVSLQVIAQQTLVDQGVLRLADAYRNVSGVAQTYNGNNVSATETPVLRGFAVGNTFWNGFRLRGQSPSVLASVQQIEVLKGPASVLYGRQEPGGIVNLVTKTPLATPYRAVEQRVGSDAYYETLLDLGAPLRADGSLRYRLNASYQNAGSFRDFVDNERWFLAPALTWKITPRTELTLEGAYMHNDLVWDNGLVFSPATFNPPFAPVLPDTRFLQEPGFRTTREETFASYRFVHEVKPGWTIRHLFLYHRNEMDLNAYRIGAVSSPAPGSLVVARRYDGTVPIATEFNAILDTTIRFTAGSARHEVLAGVDYAREPRDRNTQNGLRGLPTAQPIDAFNPVYGVTTPSAFATTSFFSERKLLGLYAQDQIALLEDRLHLLVGGRFDHVDQDSLFINPPGAPSGGAREDSAFTFRGGALYKLAAWLYPYASYSEGFVPTGTSTVGVVDPETSRQFEAGLKIPLLGEKLVANLALYDLVKDNVIGDSNNDGISENFGKLRSRGVEFDLAGRLVGGLSAILTYAYTDTEVVRSTALPVGARFVAVPLHQGSAWLRYDFADDSPAAGLSFGAGFTRVGDRPANNANSFAVRAYTRWDAFIRHRWSLAERRTLSAQVNLQNLFDEDYYETVSNLTATPGAPFGVMASLKLEF